MKQLLPLTSALLLAAGLSAQSVSGKTSTDFGNAIKSGTTTKSDSEKKDTAIGLRGLGAYSSIRGAGYASSSARVRKSTNRWTNTTTLSGSVSDRGYLYSRSSSNDSSANTTGDGGKAGAHGVDFSFSAPKDTKGKMTIYVSAGASTGGGATASVMFGGKTYAVKSGEKPMRVTLDVTLGTKAMVANVSTSGSAALKGSGRKGYSAYASLSFTYGGSTGAKCEIKDGVKGCGPTLKGTASTSSWFGPVVKLELSGAAKGAIGLQLIAKDGKTLDIGGCPVLINTVAYDAFQTSSTGTKTTYLRFPRSRDLSLSVGHVILEFGAKGLTFKSSNTLDITCKQ